MMLMVRHLRDVRGWFMVVPAGETAGYDGDASGRCCVSGELCIKIVSCPDISNRHILVLSIDKVLLLIILDRDRSKHGGR